MQARFAVDRGVAHREEKASQLKAGVEVLLDLFDSFAKLYNRVEFKIPGRDNDHDFIRSRHGVNCQRGERGRAIDEHKLVLAFDRVQLPFEPLLAVIEGSCELNVSSGEENMGGHKGMIGEGVGCTGSGLRSRMVV